MYACAVFLILHLVIVLCLYVLISMCVEEGGEEMINEKETWREYIIVRILL